MLMMRGLCSRRMMHGLWVVLRMMGPGLHRGRLMLMMRGFCGPRFTKRPGDADDAPPLWAQVYTEAG